MQRTLFLLLLLLGGLRGYAQVPGYLGKKFTVDATFQSFPAFSGPTAKNKSLTEGLGFGLNWRAVGTLGYTISRTRQLILTGDYLRTGMTADLSGPGDPFDPYSYYTYNVFYDMRGKTVGFGFRTFNPSKGAVAPFGGYHAWTLSATFLEGEIVEEYSYNLPSNASFDVDPKFTYWTLGYEVGQNFIIKDILVLNLGLRLNLPLQVNLISFDDYAEYEDNQDAFKHAAFRRMLGHSLLTVNIGAGIVF